MKSTESSQPHSRLKDTSLLLMIITLSACSPPAINEALETYTSRLQDTLGVDLESTNPIPRPKIDRRQRSLDNQSVQERTETISLLDYLSITSCELHQVLSEQNNQLGRWADPVMRLQFELRFITLAPACIDKVSSHDPDLASTLKRALAIKLARQPIHLERALLYSDEFMDFWRLGQFPSLAPDAALSESAALAALLTAAREVARNHSSISTIELNAALKPLRSGLGGQVINAWAEVFDQLTLAERTLEAFNQERPLCYRGKPNDRAERFAGLVNHVFADTLQREINRLQKMTQMVLPTVKKLEDELLTGETPALVQFQRERDELIETARALLKRHVGHLNEQLAECGLSPGGVSRNPAPSQTLGDP